MPGELSPGTIMPRTFMDLDFTIPRKNQQITPKILHQVWIGPKPPPWQWIDTFRKDFIKKHPHWVYHLWREKDIKQLTLINRNLYDRTEEGQYVPMRKFLIENMATDETDD